MCRLKHKSDKKRHLVSVVAKANTFFAGISERVGVCCLFVLIKKVPRRAGRLGKLYFNISIWLCNFRLIKSKPHKNRFKYYEQ